MTDNNNNKGSSKAQWGKKYPELLGAKAKIKELGLERFREQDARENECLRGNCYGTQRFRVHDATTLT